MHLVVGICSSKCLPCTKIFQPRFDSLSISGKCLQETLLLTHRWNTIFRHITWFCIRCRKLLIFSFDFITWWNIKTFYLCLFIYVLIDWWWIWHILITNHFLNIYILSYSKTLSQGIPFQTQYIYCVYSSITKRLKISFDLSKCCSKRLNLKMKCYWLKHAL